jgi:hypothetical protein
VTLWSSLFNQRHLISRTFYGLPGTQTIAAPAHAAFIRVSAVGAGGKGNGAFGSGAAFARVKAACAPAEQFSVQVGSIAHTSGAGDALGDSIVKRVTGSVTICKAERGGTVAGAAGNCVGDVKRSGTASSGFGTVGGASAGDDADAFPLGFGGRAASFFVGAAPGGAGGDNVVVYDNGSGFQITFNFPPGDGRVCVEFFDQDPGY